MRLYIITAVIILIVVYLVWYKPEWVKKIQEVKDRNPGKSPSEALQQEIKNLTSSPAVQQAREILESAAGLADPNKSIEEKKKILEQTSQGVVLTPESFAAQPSAPMKIFTAPVQSQTIRELVASGIAPVSTTAPISPTRVAVKEPVYEQPVVNASPYQQVYETQSVMVKNQRTIPAYE